MLLILSFTRTGTELNRKLQEKLCDLECAGYAPGRMAEGLFALPEDPKEWIKERWGKDDFLFIGAAGIAVRMIAPSIEDKYTDSAVVVMDEMSRFVIPLLSGHVGGGVALSRRIAAITGAESVITTATDVQAKFAVDVFAREHFLAITDRQLAKEISAAVLEGKRVGIFAEAVYEDVSHAVWKAAECFPELSLCETEKALYQCEKGIYITAKKIETPKGILALKVQKAVLGVGCRRGTDVQTLERGIQETIASLVLSRERIEALVSIDLKAEEEGLLQLSENWQIPFYTYTAEELASTGAVSDSSEFVQKITGVDNVCERAVNYYLKIQGGGTLIQSKIRKERMTVAVGVRVAE